LPLGTAPRRVSPAGHPREAGGARGAQDGRKPAGHRDPAAAREAPPRKLSSSYSKDEDFVFTTETAKPLYYRNLSSRGLDKSAKRACLNPEGKQKLSLHDLRHTAITHLIRAGADVGQVARFAGHARPSMTLDKYLHEFEARKGNDVASKLGQAFAAVL
jgi:integrase